MSDVSQFVSEDSRQPIERLRRRTLWDIAEARGITYPPQAPKTVMVDILKANGVDVTQPIEGVDLRWKVVNGQTADGRPNQEIYPVVPEHASARNGVNAEAVVSQRLAKQKAEEEKRIKEVEKENEDLKSLILKMQERLEALEKKPKESPRKRYWRLYREAKDEGHEVNRKMTIAELESLCGQDAT